MLLSECYTFCYRSVLITANLSIRRQAAVAFFIVVNNSISTLCTDVRVWNVVEADVDSHRQRIRQLCLGTLGPLCGPS